MIYQKKSPKTRFTFSVTNENYDFVCKAAGEMSLAAYVNLLLSQLRRGDITFCNPRNPEQNIGANTYVR